MVADLYRVECALLGNLPFNDLTSEERLIFQREKPAFDVGMLANRLMQGYYAQSIAAIVARHPSARDTLATMQPGQQIPTEKVARKNGTTHTFDSQHYLAHFNTPEIAHEIASVWLIGSLLSLGDALAEHKYLDHSPELEMVYHLRNGIAHGNRFRFLKQGIDRLKKYPAHNRTATAYISNTKFEITSNLEGQRVLFDFMGPGDVLDLFWFISYHLTYLRGRL